MFPGFLVPLPRTTTSSGIRKPCSNMFTGIQGSMCRSARSLDMPVFYALFERSEGCLTCSPSAVQGTFPCCLVSLLPGFLGPMPTLGHLRLKGTRQLSHPCPNPVSWVPCHRVSLSPSFPGSKFTCRSYLSPFQFPGESAALVPCSMFYMVPCFQVSKLPCFPAFGRTA